MLPIGRPWTDRRLKIVVLVKSRYGDDGSDLSLRVGIVNIQCNVNQGRTPDPTILAAEHFDDETIAVVYRVKRDGACWRCPKRQQRLPEDYVAFLSTMVHSDLEYLDVPYETGVAANLEDLVQSAINEWKAGNVWTRFQAQWEETLTAGNAF